jgi:hypothetical protein
MVDFPLDGKILITENTPTENPEFFHQVDSLHGTGGAITLNFDALPHPSTNFTNNFTWTQLQKSESGTELTNRPLRLAVSSSGLSKTTTVQATIKGTPYILWGRSHLENMAIAGEDPTFLACEDALVFGHCNDDSDTRFEYVPLTKQHHDIIEKLHQSIRAEDDIERVRLTLKGQKHPKDIPKLGAQFINDLHDAHGGRASIETILINDQNEERVQFRDKYIEQYPEFRSQVLTDDQKREYRAILQASKNTSFFLNENLPLPVVTPLRSHTQQKSDQFDNEDLSFAVLTSNDAFGNMAKEIPLMKRAVLGVADGVGGMANYGTANETKQMSHRLMRLVRHNLTSSTRSARDLLGQAHTSLVAENSITLGACTASIGVISPAEPEEPEDEFDDGRRLKLSIANIGDSTVIAFRPKHNRLLGTTTYVPLAVTWPMYHSGTGPALPPVQFTLYNYQHRPPTPDVPADAPNPPLTSSHFSTPTLPESGPSGGNNLFTSAKEYNDFLGGKVALSSLFKRLTLTPDQAGAVDRSTDFFAGDQPWLAQAVDDVTLRRGDVVCTFSDGIGDNLQNESYIATAAQVRETVDAYVNPVIRAQHPAIRNVRPFYQVPSKETDHLNGAIISKKHKPSLEEILTNTDTFTKKLPEGSIPPFSAEDSSAALLSDKPICAERHQHFLYTKQGTPSTLKTVMAPQPDITPEQVDSVYRFNYATSQGPRFHSTLTADEEGVVAGTLATSMVGGMIHFSMRGTKFDDMSCVAAVVY